MGGGRLPVAVVTSALGVRGIVAAISWFHPALKAFHPDRLDAAFAHLEVGSDEGARLLAAARSLAGTLSPPIKIVG